MANIIVTGANGFVGRHLVRHLLARGHKVSVLDRSAQHAQPGENAQVAETGRIYLDALETVTFSQGEAPQALIHLAALAHVKPAGDQIDLRFQAPNVELTRRLVAFSRNHRIANFIFLSSIGAVTDNVNDAIVDDRTVPAPVTAYGKSKLDAEKIVGALANEGLFAISLRPPLIAGHDAAGNWALLQKIAASGLPLPFAGIHNRRSLVAIATLCRIITHLAEGSWNPSQSGSYCIAEGGPVSIEEILRNLRQGMAKPARLFRLPPAALDLIGSLTGKKREIASLTGNLQLDPTRLYDVFGIDAEADLAAEIRRSGSEYRKNGSAA